MKGRLLAVAPVTVPCAAVTAACAWRGWWFLVALGVVGTAGWLYVAIFDV